MNNPGKASLPVIKRLPKYYRYLRTLKNDGITSISSRELAAQMGTTASQVRQDFNCIGDVNGRQGIGYSVENLLSILEHLLFGNGDRLPTILIGEPVHHHRHQRLQAHRCFRQCARRSRQRDQRHPDPSYRPA